MPSDTRVNPACSRPSKNAGEVLSGLDSVVTSASSARVNDARIASITSASPSAPSSDGVPPPTKTVDTGRAGSIAAAASRNSVRTAAIQEAGDDDDPSSPGV